MKKLMLTVAATAMIARAFATTYSYWQGPNGGDYWDSDNWSAGVPDKAGMVARFSTVQKPEAGTTVSMTNASAIKADRLEVSNDTWTWKVAGALELEGATNDKTTISVGNSAKLTIEGAVLENQSIGVTTGTGGGKAALEFKNCVTRGLYTLRRSGSDVDAPDTYTVNGGDYRIRTWYPRLYDCMVVNDGIVRFGSIHGYDRYSEGKDVRLRTQLQVKGGKAVVDGEDSDITSGTLGIVAKERGVVEITVSGKNIWLASGSNDGKHSVDVAWRVQDRALFTAAGPYVVGPCSTGSVEVVGGRFVMTSSFANAGGGGSGRCSYIRLNGGVLDFDYPSDGTLVGTQTDVEGSFHKLVVGLDGARLRNRNNVNVTIGDRGFVSADEGTGGVTFDGKGKFILPEVTDYEGDMTVRGRIQPSVAANGFGTGTLTLKDGGMLMTQLTSETVLPDVKYENAAFIQLNNAAAHASAPSVSGEDDSVLFLVSDASRTAFGTTDARYFACETPPTLDALGLPTTPIVAVTKEEKNSAAEVHLLTYDADTGKFKNAEYVTDLATDGTDKIAYVTANTSLNGKKFGAVVVKGASINGQSTVGNGSGNAYLVLLAHSNSATQGQLTGAGTVQFGKARGYVLCGAGVSGQVSCGVNGYLAGSAGVIFATLNNGGIHLYRNQSYTGGTKIISGIINLTTSGSYQGEFGNGTVEVCGGEYTGGSVRFNYAGTHAHNYTISGFGAATDTKTGALDFRKNTTLSGKVTLANDAMIGATSGNTGTLAQSVGGTGDLYLVGEGTLALAGIDIAGDVHVSGNVVASGSIATGERFLFVDGTLTFDNATDVTVDAKVMGAGRIVLAGTGHVNFSDLSIFDGVIDLAGKNATIGEFYGAATVTNSSATAATLAIDGKSDVAYFGTVGENVNLSVGGEFLLGPTAEVPATAGLTLAAGTLGLYENRTFASLAGNGTVEGQKLTVTGNTNPTMPTSPAATAAIAFDTYPSLNSLSFGWALKAAGAGAVLKQVLPLMLIFR